MTRRPAPYASTPAAPVTFTVVTLPNGVSAATAKATDFRTHMVSASSEIEARDRVAGVITAGHYVAEVLAPGVESTALLRARARATEEAPPADLRSGTPGYISNLGGQS